MHVYSIDFDSSYPTGGEAVTPDNVGLTRIDHAIIAPRLGFVFSFDLATSKIKAFQGDNTNAAAAPLIEVPNATNMAAETGILGIFFGV